MSDKSGTIELLDPVSSVTETDCFATVKFTWDAMHFAPHSPGAVEFETVPHVHTFHITGSRRVAHSERDVWPQVLRSEMIGWLDGFFREAPIGQVADIEAYSCAALAKQLLTRFGLDECEILEDGRAGATVRRAE